MSELGPDARSLLAAASGGDDPSFDDEARVRAKIAARLAIAASVGAATTLGAKSATAATAGAGAAGTAATASTVTLTTKLILALAITTGATGATVVAVRSTTPPVVQTTAPRTTTPDQPASHAPVPVLVPVPVPVPALTPAPTASSPTANPAPAATAAARAAVTTTATATAAATAIATANPNPLPHAAAPTTPPAAAPVAVPAAPDDPLTAEVALLRSAQSALARGDATTAMSRLDDHAARFPRGALSEERAAARVHALCAQGHASEARAAATAFVASHPRSSLAPAVRKSCAVSAP